jgi:sigma-B regulation protein RsbU (phosphoserine phosphatase)
MASLRAYLRGQTTHRNPDLAKLMANLNRLIFESSASNKYATFFYAQYDSTTRVLDYANGGHNPPMVFRTNGARVEVLRLEAGGPVVGLLPDCVYAQGTMTLEPGDLLVAFTDGISEAMNARDEAWDEDRLTEAVRSAGGSARDVIAHIMQAADAFVAGAPQHDDMTLVVARVGT